MSEQRYDFVIFGATGFTGQFVVDEVARVMEEEGGTLKMAVAGRSMEKLQKMLRESSQRTGISSLWCHVMVIILTYKCATV